jgi:hypothetical protein
MFIKKSPIRRTINRVFETLNGIPYLTRRRRTPIAAYVFGSIGLALASAGAALMFFSPRTRTRAFDAAKGTYGKVNARIVHRRVKGVLASNGEAEQPTTSG